MSSAADIEVWDNATQKFENGSLQEAINLYLSMAAISSKISFNIGSAFLAQEKIEDSLKVRVHVIKCYDSVAINPFEYTVIHHCRIHRKCFSLRIVFVIS